MTNFAEFNSRALEACRGLHCDRQSGRAKARERKKKKERIGGKFQPRPFMRLKEEIWTYDSSPNTVSLFEK